MSENPLKVFENFDFKLLNDPDFREDSVREELVVPLITALGYSAADPHRIVRSRRLEHPYVYIGTVRKPITIIPDYLLKRDGQNAWILDAKGPNENIAAGKNVEQAYSYAIHKDVRVPLYALCNGRRLIVFHISQGPPVLDVALDELPSKWTTILTILGTRAAWPNGIHPEYFPDFGMALLKAGLAVDVESGKPFAHAFLSISVECVGKAADDLFVITGFLCSEFEPSHIITFDITAGQVDEFLSHIEPHEVRAGIEKGLACRPFTVHFGQIGMKIKDVMLTLPTIAVVAEISGAAIETDNDSYLPFTVKKFF